MHAPKNAEFPFKAELTEAAANGTGGGAVEACRALARVGGDADLPLLTRLLDDPDADLRAAAANALLRIDRRVSHRLGFWDLAVIAVYLLAMLAVGWYYSRRAKNQEQYLLGDRKMRPSMIGISLFASLISSLSYLAVPGEVIKYGPMYLSVVLAYPLVASVVGYKAVNLFTAPLAGLFFLALLASAGSSPSAVGIFAVAADHHTDEAVLPQLKQLMFHKCEQSLHFRCSQMNTPRNLVSATPRQDAAPEGSRDRAYPAGLK